MKIKWLVPVLMSGNLSIAFAQSHFEEPSKVIGTVAGRKPTVASSF